MQSIAWWPTLAVLIAAAATDIRSRRIPNWLVVPFLLAGVFVGIWTQGWAGLERSMAGISLAAATFGTLCYLRGMGMGDLKLCAAIGAWIGPAQLVCALVATAIAGGILAVMYALWHKSLGKCLDGTADLWAGFSAQGLRPNRTITLDNPHALKLPYAVAIAIGTIFSFYAL
jgi:prepilin peptidase CpaA